MDELKKLLAVVEGLDAEKRKAEEPAPSDEELTAAKAGLVVALKAALEGDSPDVEAGKPIREAINAIDAEMVTREENAVAAKVEAAKLLEGLEAKDEGEEEEPAKEDEADKPEDKPEDEEAAAPEVKEDEKVLVTASLSEAITRSAKRASQRKIERVDEPAPKTSDVLVAAIGIAQGTSLPNDATLSDVAELFDHYAPSVRKGEGRLLRMERQYPDERMLGSSDIENTAKLDAVTSPRAIVAAGGICDPGPADFSHPICGERGRPIFNANPIFGLPRGQLRYAPSATVADLEDAITVWTAETDETPGSAVKACPRVECEEELTTNVDAIVACLTVGNFQARFNPEFWASRLDLLMVAHDRIAEQTLYATIESGSTQVTYAGGCGTVGVVLEAIDKYIAGAESRHRLFAQGFTAIMPAFLQDALRTHLVCQAPAGSLDLFAVADAQLNNFFTSRRVTPVWSPDIEVYGTQGEGALLDFPGGNVDIVIYPNGTWITGDGGSLDLGTNITDSTLNATNDRQAFMETFEVAFKRGCESVSIAVTIGEECICLAA